MNPADTPVSRSVRRRPARSAAGFNRTGAQSSPLALRSMQSYADEQAALPPAADCAAGKGIAAVRLAYVREAGEVGSVPMPGAITDAFAPRAAHRAAGAPELLVDKLGERLSWERSSVRLYQALMDKTAALAAGATLPLQLEELHQLREEALEHMHIAASALDSLGADSSALTPSAAISALVIHGVTQVLTDPRTTLHQCLEAILTVELADEASWELLMRLAEVAGQDELLFHFHRAFRHEHVHVHKLKRWREQLVLGTPEH